MSRSRNALVVGQGSIGQRHAAILRELNLQVSTVSRHLPKDESNFSDLAEAFAAHIPSYVVIANDSALHHETLSHLSRLRFNGPVLVEKPLFSRSEAVELGDMAVHVGYQMRFQPTLAKLSQLLGDQKIVSAHAYVGQHLSLWRKNRPYEQSYSASKKGGGGVLRDLSHELDTATWLLGRWKRVTALGGHFSSLSIDSDDVFSLLLETERCPVVSVSMNYLDRCVQRILTINTAEHTYVADVIQGRLSVDGAAEQLEAERNFAYMEMHQRMLDRDGAGVCSLEEGLDVLRLIEAAEDASARGLWIGRS